MSLIQSKDRLDGNESSSSKGSLQSSVKVSNAARQALNASSQKVPPKVLIRNYVKVPLAANKTINQQTKPAASNVDQTNTKIILQSINEVLLCCQENTRLLAELTPKVTSLSDQLTVLSDKINNLPNQGTQVRYIRPNFLPFKTVEEVDAYDDFSEDERAKLRHYLSAFCGGQNATENVKFLLKNNLLFDDQLLIAYNFALASHKKSNVFKGTAIDHDLFSVLRVMFPTMQKKEYHEALKSALKNADQRVGKKQPQANDAEIPPEAKKKSKKRSLPSDFYDIPFVKKPSQNTEEFENHEDDN